MSSVMEFIKAGEYNWQPSFSGVLGSGAFGYRGALIVEHGKQISPDRKLPPKIQAKQVIMIGSAEEIDFLACELENFSSFEPLFALYGKFFKTTGLYLLYVTDLEANGTFVYQGIAFHALVLDESSVWNELVELGDLDKGALKKMSSEEKIEALYEGLLEADVAQSEHDFEEMLGLVGKSSKQIMGAV